MGNPANSVFSSLDEDAEEQALAAAEADILAGRLIPHEAMKQWLQSWGTPDQRPRPVPDADGDLEEDSGTVPGPRPGM